MQMRTGWMMGLIVVACWGAAFGELQNVSVGGKLEMYGSYWSDFYTSGPVSAYGPWQTHGRPLGINGTGTGISGGIDRVGQSTSYVQQRTRIHLNADFTDNVSAFVEFDDVETWGEDFRSNYLTGADLRANSVDDVEVFQSYIEMKEIAGLPLSVRVGRQALDFGSGWLVGSDYGGDPFAATSFDAVRLTCATDTLTADAWWGKMSESMRGFAQGDIDFYGIYLTCAAVEDMTFDLYWLYVRDAANTDLGLSPLSVALARLTGRAEIDTSSLHTVGLRWAGKRGPWDWEAEAAYQFGNADTANLYSRPWPGLSGDTTAHWGQAAAHAEVGYTLDMPWTPRLFLGGAYYGGEDQREISFLDSLNPFDRPQAGPAFNRLFSITCEDIFLDSTILSNIWEAHAGAGIAPTEQLSFKARLQHLEVVAPFDRPVFALFPWWTREGSRNLGWQTWLTGAYQYSADLLFEFGWYHYFAGDAYDTGAFIMENGTRFAGGFGHEDGNYLYCKVSLTF